MELDDIMPSEKKNPECKRQISHVLSHVWNVDFTHTHTQ